PAAGDSAAVVYTRQYVAALARVRALLDAQMPAAAVLSSQCGRFDAFTPAARERITRLAGRCLAGEPLGAGRAALPDARGTAVTRQRLSASVTTPATNAHAAT